MASLLYGVKPHDPLVFLGVALMLVATASFASWGRALKAASILRLRCITSNDALRRTT